MYAGFFGLRQLPFNSTPDPRFFYATPDHEEALASLIYCVGQRKGLTLLTGEIGTGKTLLSKVMLAHFNRRIEVANVSVSNLSGEDLLSAICLKFGIEIQEPLGKVRATQRLHDFLLEQFHAQKPVVLVLDEAQNLTDDACDTLRMISNFETDEDKLIQITLIGQPQLRRWINRPGLRQLRQRVFRSYHLPALDRSLTEQYINHRLQVAGAPGHDIFDAVAIDAVYQLTNGVPRMINGLCDNAMLAAYAANTKIVSEEQVRAVVDQTMADAMAVHEPHHAEKVDTVDDEDAALVTAVPVATELVAPLAQTMLLSESVATPTTTIAGTEIADRLSPLERTTKQAVHTTVTGNTILRRLDAVEQKINQAISASALDAAVADQITGIEPRLEQRSGHSPSGPPNQRHAKQWPSSQLDYDLDRAAKSALDVVNLIRSETDEDHEGQFGLQGLTHRLEGAGIGATRQPRSPVAPSSTDSIQSENSPFDETAPALDGMNSAANDMAVATVHEKRIERFQRLRERADAALTSRAPGHRLLDELRSLTAAAERLRISTADAVSA